MLLTINLKAKIPSHYQQSSDIAYNYIDNKQYVLAYNAFEEMLNISIKLKDDVMQYRITNTMSALSLVSNNKNLLYRSYMHLNNIKIKSRNTKYYWLITKIVQKLNFKLYPASIYHHTMCILATINQERKYLKLCSNKRYFLSNFLRNYKKEIEHEK
jgi:hypothetical protein